MAKLYLHDIVNVEPEAVSAEIWTQLVERIDQSDWYEWKRGRIGFVNTICHRGVIAGYFANEGTKTGIQYDEDKHQISPEPFYSFEHVFFALFRDTMQLLLQRKNIYDYEQLDLPTIRENLLDLLSELLRLVGVYVRNRIELEVAGRINTQQELFRLFTTTKRVVEIEVSNLREASLPSPEDPQYRLFNPEDEWNELTWRAIADSQGSGLDRVAMSTSEDPEATLQSAIPKGYATVGQIEEIRGYDQEGRLYYRERVEDAELEIELPIGRSTDEQLIDRIFDRLESLARVESWEQRRERRRREQDPHGWFDD